MFFLVSRSADQIGQTIASIVPFDCLASLDFMIFSDIPKETMFSEKENVLQRFGRNLLMK